MTIFQFLDNVSGDNKILQKLREETASKQKVRDLIIQDDLDDFATVDELETEEVGDEAPGYPIKPTRRTSATLLQLLHKADPRLECEKRSDLACLLMYVSNNVKQFDFGKDLTKLEDYLTKLGTVVNHLHPSSSSLRNYFVELTSIFKAYWVAKGENNKSDYHVDVIRRVLRAPSSRVSEVLAKKEAVLRDKLGDKYYERWEDVERICREMYARGMGPGANREDMMCLLLSLILSSGARKSAWIDPNVGFTSWSSYKAKQTKGGKESKMAIGIVNGDDDEDLIGISSEDQFQEQIGMEHVIVQTGVLKDSETSINKYLDVDDDRHVAERELVKPTIILTARQIIDGTKVFRKWTGITKATFKGRKTAGNRYGTNDLGPIIQHYFPRAYAKSKAKKWPISSHYCRKLYATSAFHIYSAQIQRLSGKYIDKSVFSAAILGHGSASLATSLSYANCVVEFGFVDEQMSLPPEHQIRLLRGETAFLRDQVAELKKMIQNASATAVGTIATGEVSLKDTSGALHNFPKHSKIKWTDVRHRDQTIKLFVDRLREKGVPATYDNMEGLGFGRGTYYAYLKKKPIMRAASGALTQIKEEKDITPPALVMKDRALGSDGPASTAEVPIGTKVIAVTNPKASENAKKQAVKRNIEVFGADNVIETVDDCTNGVIFKRRKIETSKGTTLVRDVCEEKR